MNHIFIVHVNHNNSKLPSYLIDRTTCLGNPYRIGQDGTRKEVVALYEQWFEKAKDDPKVRKYLNSIYDMFKHKDINLVCHCAPALCHGSVIKRYLERRWRYDNKETQT